MMDFVELLLHPSTVSFALGNLSGGWLAITLLFRMKRKLHSEHGGRG